jgi:MYXO-CTERM domain-containing protein
MRRLHLTCFALGSLALSTALPGAALLGCRDASSGEHVIRAAEPIQGGTLDTGDSAVVAILINTSQGMSICSGSLIAPNLVLTAHHCVADSFTTSCTSNGFGSPYAASSFRVTTSATAAATIFNSNNPSWPAADGATWWGVSSVTVPGNNICGQDMAMLRLSAPITGVCPLIPRVDTQIADGDGYTAIGFGVTSPNGQTAGTRYKVGGLTVECVTDCNDPTQSSTLEWLGGTSSPKGTCEGDSGGPAIDASGRVIGTVSRGPQGSCNQTVYESVYGEAAWIKQVATQAATAGGYTAAGWVTGGSTADPANGYCGGSSSSSSSSSSTSSSTSSSSSSSSGGGGAPTDCSQADGNIGCCTSTGVLYYCTQTNTLKQQTCTNGTVCGWNAQQGYYDCVAPPGGADPSSMYPLLCGGSTSSSSSSSSTSSSTSASSTSSSSGSQCTGAMPTGNAACDACIDGSCCAQLVACSNDQTCVSCASSANPPASCGSNQPLVALFGCLQNSCGAQCGSSSSSSSSSSGSSSSGSSASGSSGGGATSSSSGIFGSSSSSSGSSASGSSSSSGAIFSGAGGGGTGNNGTGGAGGNGNEPGMHSGCNVAPGGGEPASPASFAGLLLGAALVVARRRR